MTAWLGDYMVAYHELYAVEAGGSSQQSLEESPDVLDES